jgi:predicted regulator of Ras-like GTPase activity (Roadblock/LC7/MglB family)
MFGELLDRLLREVPGARVVTVMGFDGIAIETRDKDGAAKEAPAAVELAAVTSQLRRAAEGLDEGDVREVSLETGGSVTLLRPLTSEYCLAMTLASDALVGKGRYLMRVLAPAIAQELG